MSVLQGNRDKLMVLMGGGAAFKWLAQLCRRVYTGVAPVLQWSQGLLDGEGGHPSQKVEQASSLVIRACRCEEERGGEGMGLVGTELVSVYISVCAALAVTGGTIAKKTCLVEPHPPKAPPTETHQPEALASKWLLSHNGARGLVIDVEVAFSMSQNAHALLHYIPVASKHAAC